MHSQYPLGTVAVYGPTDKQATKVVASVVPFANARPTAVKKWSVGAGDIRENATIQSELSLFLKENLVARAIVTEEVVGCPHEDGVDYPHGSTCPFCPFWATRPSRRTSSKSTEAVGRNDLCPCGSGKKYKKCCGP